MVAVVMIKFFLKIYKNSGLGATHVITRTGNFTIKRWGIWTPFLTILFSKIFPVEQVPHNHEGSFISFLLWGTYDEIVNGKKTKKRWLNFLPYKNFHKIVAEKPVYTIMFMGKTRQNTSVIVNNKTIPSQRLIKGYK